MNHFVHDVSPIKVLIFGHKEFSQLVSNLMPKYEAMAKFIIVDALIGSAEEVKSHVKVHQPDVILSGGANAMYLQSCLDIPVVPTQVTEADIIEAVKRASQVSPNIVLITFNGPSPVVPLLEDALGIQIKEETYSRTDEAREIFHIVSKQPDVVIVGASLVCGLASQSNIRSVLFYSARSCALAMEKAIQQGRQRRGQLEQKSLHNWLMNQSKTPIIMADPNGNSLTLNQAAKRDLNLSLDFEFDLQDLIHPQENAQPSDGECSINGSDWWFHRDEVQNDTQTMNVYQLYRKKPKNPTLPPVTSQPHQMAFQSADINKVMSQISSFASSPSNVLIYGESGTGKELVAREIYNKGAFSQGKFVALNCSAIPTELFEGELFGHQDGAYTGSRRGGRKGLIEEAQGGVLFLDEISELALDQQSKLLRFLQERMFRPLGANEEKSVHLKLVAASNKPLHELVEEGSFRHDLFYRLNVFNITIPPLRQRPEDVLCIAQSKLDIFLERYQLQMDSEIVLDSIKHLLTRYTWPGNVRELENILERLVAVLSPQQDLSNMEDLVRDIAPELFLDQQLSTSKSRIKNKELEMVADAMVQFSGDKQQVANYLGLSQTTLWRRLKHLQNN